MRAQVRDELTVKGRHQATGTGAARSSWSTGPMGRRRTWPARRTGMLVPWENPSYLNMG
jgi:hypothetical protein